MTWFRHFLALFSIAIPLFVSPSGVAFADEVINKFDEVNKSLREDLCGSTNCPKPQWSKSSKPVGPYKIRFPTSTLQEFKNKKIKVSVVPAPIAAALFDEMKNHPDIPFGYPEDGCYARAHRMAQLLEAKSIITAKILTEGEFTAETKAAALGYVHWGYHIAPIIAVEDENGDIKPMIIDPSLFDQLITVDEWISKLTKWHKPAPTISYILRFGYDLYSKKQKKWNENDQKNMNETLQKYLQVQQVREQERKEKQLQENKQ